MVDTRHEALHKAHEADSLLYFKLARWIGGDDVPLPDAAQAVSAEACEHRVLERHVDSIVMASLADGQYGLIIEAQLRQDPRKRVSWPYYVSYMHNKYDCPIGLLVICNDESTARWARRPIEIKLPGLEGLSLVPTVSGPDNVPIIRDMSEVGGDIGLAAISALTHSRSKQVNGILELLAKSLKAADKGVSKFWSEYVDAGVKDTDAYDSWRTLMFKEGPYQPTLISDAKAIGEARGEAKAVLWVLRNRNIHVSPAERDHILDCTDEQTLERWLNRAMEAASIDDVFAGE